MIRFLFQGDSITEAGRDKVNLGSLGNGYVAMISERLNAEKCEEYEIINRGIGGDCVISLIDRMKNDMIDLKPDIMSVLVGVNDVWHEVRDHIGFSTETYEELYDHLISEVKKALPDIHIVIMEPFVLRNAEWTEEYWEAFNVAVHEKGQAARRVAKQNNLLFVPLQGKINELAQKMSNEYVLRDGIHPTQAGHELIFQELYCTLKSFL